MAGDVAGADKLADASSVLVSTPEVRDAPVSACAGLISNGDGDADHVIGVAVSRSATDWVDAWQRATDDVTAELTCVDVESSTRSAAAASGRDRQRAATVRPVADATDLETLGETLTDLMTASEAETVAVCLHSLTDLLGHVDERNAFRFVTTLGELARNHGATVYVNVDSRASDAETVSVFAAACDAIVEFDEDAGIRVR